MLPVNWKMAIKYAGLAAIDFRLSPGTELPPMLALPKEVRP